MWQIKFIEQPLKVSFQANRSGNWIEDYFILEDVKVEKVTEEVEIEGAKKLISYKSETIDISDDWSIKYENWSYGDVICSNVTESSIGITVPEEDFANELWPWVQVIRKPVTLNPGETYFVSADYVSNYEGYVGFNLWNSTDNITVSTTPLDGGICYTNTSDSSKQYWVYSYLKPGCIHIISNFKETIISPTSIWKDWSYLFVGKDDSFEALSVSNNGISFNIEDDFDLCAVDLTLDLKAGERYRIDYTITGPNSEILIGSMLYTNGNTSESYKADSFYLYDNRTDNFSDYIYVTDDCTGKGVLRFHPQVPGTYTISNIRITEESLGGESVTPGGNVSDGNNSTDCVPPSDSGSTSEIVLLENKELSWEEAIVTIGDNMTNIKVGDKVYFTLTATGKQECQFIKKYWEGGLGTGIISIYDAETDVDVTFYAADIAEGSPADRPSVILDSGDEDSTTKTFYFIVTDAFMELKDIATVVGSATIVKMWY